MAATTTTDRAYKAIRKRLVSGELGLREQALAEAIGVSRTPVREALARLKSEGIVEQIPRRGVSVRTLDETQLYEVYEVREMLECHAVAKAANRLTEQDLRELDDLCEQVHELAGIARISKLTRLDGELLSRSVKSDFGFHRKLMNAAGNSMSVKMFEDLHILSHIQDYCVVLPEENPLRELATTWRSHLRILRALRRRDAAAASQLMSNHIRYGLGEHLRLLKQSS